MARGLLLASLMASCTFSALAAWEGLTGWGHRRSTRTTTPGLSVTPEIIDLGEVGQDQALPVNFVVNSSLPYTLRLFDTSKACSCTEVMLTESTIPPGGSVPLSLVWKTQKRRGQVSLPVTVRYLKEGDESAPLYSATATIVATVIPDMIVSPTMATFEPGIGEVTVEFAPGRKSLPKLIRATSSVPKSVRVELRGNRLHVWCEDGSDLTGQYILVETDGPPLEWIQVPLRSRVK